MAPPRGRYLFRTLIAAVGGGLWVFHGACFLLHQPSVLETLRRTGHEIPALRYPVGTRRWTAGRCSRVDERGGARIPGPARPDRVPRADTASSTHGYPLAAAAAAADGDAVVASTDRAHAPPAPDAGTDTRTVRLGSAG